MRNPLAALAGKKAKKLYRNPDGSTVLHVDDEHDEILVTVAADGSMYEHRVFGLAGVREALDAASPYAKVLVPDDTGRKVWSHLEPEPEDEPPAAVPEPEPAPASRRVDPQYQPPALAGALWIPLRSPDPRRIGRLCAGLVRGRGSIWVTGPVLGCTFCGYRWPWGG